MWEKIREITYLFLKRSLDFLGAGMGVVLLSPLLACISLLVYYKLGSPIFFQQKRPGLGGEPFFIYKFRTMTEKTDKNGNLLPDEERLTSFGKFLRKYSLDELPELLNVLKGDMSLVGPRPLKMKYLDRYSDFQARRHEVLPGITGWSQVSGRNLLDWEERLQKDVWYVDNRTIWLDLKIIFLTFLKVFKKEGISAEQHATMPEFQGDDSRDDTQND